jgi:hypothetical protein
MFHLNVSRYRAPLFFLLFITALSIPLIAQQSNQEKAKEKEASGKKEAAPKLVKVSGAVRCEKPDPAYALEVPDRPGHFLNLNHRKCTWTEPMQILGAKTKTGDWYDFTERMEGSLHPHSYEIDSMDDGEKITFQTMGHVDSEKNPTTVRGRFSYMRGTGKLKGIKGGGTYEGKIDANDVMTLELEGEYDPAAFAGGNK